MARDKTQIEEAYAAREIAIERLAQAASISLEDLVGLDALARYTVACDLWHKCNKAVRAALLNDAHVHVRSAATRMNDR